MVCMDLSIIVMCSPCEHMFKLSGLILSLKAFIFNLLSPLYTFMLKPLYLHMLVIVWIYLMILSKIFEVQFSD